MTVENYLISELQNRLESYSWQSFAPTVFVGKTVFDPDSDPLPVVTIVASTSTREKAGYGMDRVDTPVEVTAIVSLKNGGEIWEICDPIFKEMKTALLNPGTIDFEDDFYVPILCTGGGISIYPDHIGPAIAQITVNLVFRYTDQTTEPEE